MLTAFSSRRVFGDAFLLLYVLLLPDWAGMWNQDNSLGGLNSYYVAGDVLISQVYHVTWWLWQPGDIVTDKKIPKSHVNKENAVAWKRYLTGVLLFDQPSWVHSPIESNDGSIIAKPPPLLPPLPLPCPLPDAKCQMDRDVPPNIKSWDLFIREHLLHELSGQRKLKLSLIWPFTLFSLSFFFF